MILRDTLLNWVLNLGAPKDKQIGDIAGGGFSNGWTNYQDPITGTWRQVGYYTDNFGFTHHSGMMSSGALALPSHSIDVSSTPPTKHMLATVSVDALARLDIISTGHITPVSGNNIWVSIESAECPTFTDGWVFPTLTGGWINYTPTNTDWAYGGYYQDPLGIVHLQGLVKFGGTGSSNPIFTLPENMRPEHQMLFATIGSSGADVHVDLRIDTNGDIYTLTASSSFLTLSGISFIPTSSELNNEWKDLALLNSWVNHGGGYAPPQYLIAPTGIVYYRGLIKDGTTTLGTNIFELPDGATVIRDRMRPASSNGFGALDIRLHGYCSVRVANSAYLSLDNQRYRVEY